MPAPMPAPMSPQDALLAPGPGAAELADTLVALVFDIALVLDAAGRIRHLAQHADRPLAPDRPQPATGEPATPPAERWMGQPWADTVEADSHDKVQQMLAEVASQGRASRRELNHRPWSTPGAPDVRCVAYCATRWGPQGPTLALGQHLVAQAEQQQRWLAAMAVLEQHHWLTHQQPRPAPAPRTVPHRQAAARPATSPATSPATPPATSPAASPPRGPSPLPRRRRPFRSAP